MKFLILFSIIFALGIVAINQDVFADCAVGDQCYSRIQVNTLTPTQGLEYELDSPDLWIDRNACQNYAVSTGWLVATTGLEWVESGITKGELRMGGTEDPECITLLSTYYALQFIDGNTGEDVYQEYVVPNGRVDPGEDVKITIEDEDLLGIAITVTTPTVTNYPARVILNYDNLYYADFGIEGSVSALDDYSSIPMSKFTNIKVKQNNSWINIPTAAVVITGDAADGYLGMKCPTNSFIAGTVMSLDCNNIAVTNQAPNVSTLIYNPVSNAPITIPLDATDTDHDYLVYNLIEIPTNGFLNYNNLGQKIPNTDGDSSQLVYTPASSTPENDIIRYSVTDVRLGHTEEGLITIIGPDPGPTIPDVVDDFDFTLSGTTITFTWSHPYDGGSPLESYRIQHSDDTVTWINQVTISETLTSYDDVRYEGYDEYFRIFANNAFGDSAASDVVHVHIDDTTGPTVTIQNPLDSEIFPTTDVSVDGFIYESENSGIRDIHIQVDGITATDLLFTIILLEDVSVTFDSVLTSLSNGLHTITAFASNDDGYTGSDSVIVTVDVPEATTLDSFSEDFEGDMSNWIVTTEDDEFWSIRVNPLATVPDSLPGNKVSGTEDCDEICTMIMIDNVDINSMTEPTLNFYRYVAIGADIPGEGIIAYYSEDNGSTWNVLDSFLADNFDDDGIWNLEEYDLSIYSSSEFKVKFEAISDANSEDTELDDVKIFDADAVDITEPVITLTNSTITIEVNSAFTDPGYSASDDVDGDITSSVIVTGSVDTSVIGVYYLYYDVADSSGNDATQVIRTVNVIWVNQTPTANDETDETDEDTPLTITLSGDDSDGDSLLFSILTLPIHGTLGTINSTSGLVTYTPGFNFNGEDSFTYSVNDGTINSNTATVSITVSSINDAVYGTFAIGVNSETNTIYATSAFGGFVSVIDGDTNSIDATITVSGYPRAIDVDSDSNTIFVASAGDKVRIIDGDTNTVTDTITVGDNPRGVAFNNVTNTIYVTNGDDGTVSVIDGSTGTITETISVGTFPFAIDVNTVTNFIYVTNHADNTVSVIDGSTNEVTDTISVDKRPRGVAVNDITNTIYVTNYGDGTVSVIDGYTNLVTETIPVGNQPWSIAVDYITNTIYVANQASNANTVSVIDGYTNLVTETIPVGTDPRGIAVNTITNTVYTGSFDDDTVTVIDGTNIVTIPIIPSGMSSFPFGVDVNNNTNFIYVANNLNSTVSVIDASTNEVTETITGLNKPHGVAVDSENNIIYVTNYAEDTVSIIDGDTNTVTTTLPVGDGPWSITFNNVTNTIYVGNQGDSDEGNSVSVIDGDTKTVTETIPVGTDPRGIAVNESTNTIYVGSFDDFTVSVINGTTNEITDIISTGNGTFAIGVNNISNTIYATNAFGGTVSVINGDTNSLLTTITEVKGYPRAIDIDYTNNLIYVASAGDSVRVIDGTTNTLSPKITVGDGPRGISFNYINNLIYVTNSDDDTVSVIDGTTGTVTDTIDMGNSSGTTTLVESNGITTPFESSIIYVENEADDDVIIIDDSSRDSKRDTRDHDKHNQR